MPPRKKGAAQPPTSSSGIGEAARLCLALKLKTLLDSEEAELVLPSSLSLAERAYVHNHAIKLGLKTKSRGSGGKRYVTVYKRSDSTLVRRDATVVLDPCARRAVAELIETFPVTAKEKEELSACDRERTARPSATLDGIGSHPAPVPAQADPPPSQEILNQRRSLPVAQHADRIVEAIESGRVVIVVGETGCGKTTQIPQFLLERRAAERKRCRIVCTQPRRISAVSVADRVAQERNERVGETVGYRIRSESKTGAKTALTFCTNGVLLRALTNSASALATVTHVLVDEIHERDRFADFLLIALRDAIAEHPDLRVVLMSATMDTSLFTKYFDGCPIFSIPGRTYDVQKSYLERVLPMLNYQTEPIRKILREKKNAKDGKEPSRPTKEDRTTQIDPDLQVDFDEFLQDCLDTGGPDSFGQILYMYISEGVPVDCPHSETGMTGLMAAARHGSMDTIQEIIKIGGSLTVVDKQGKNARDYATEEGHTDCVEYLKNLAVQFNSAAPVQESRETTRAVEDLVDAYLQTVEEDAVDYELILAIIKYLHLTQPKGSILVFLTGYDDIIFLRDSIQSCVELRNGTYQLFILHSNMQTADQKKIFLKLPSSRKIILSTNIAETSITIEDVVYVIDCGMVKQTGFESLTGVSFLQKSWISKACALQRAGRAGRTQPGKAFLTYTKKRFDSFADQTTAEILRVPLHELCLHTKLLAPSNTSIADYLAKAVEPPSSINVKNSIALLKTIGALTPMEELTEIGQHLSGLSIEPKYGKMILYACVLKCLDPILTIACSLATKEPFQINPDKEKRKGIQDLRKDFAADSLSDHMVLLRVFQAWQTARINKSDKSFCEKNFISRATMEMIVTVRTQLLAQLRAIGFLKTRGAGDMKDMNQNSDKWHIIKAALVAGLYPSVARIDKEECTLRSSKEAKLVFHPRSALHTGRGKAGLIKSLEKITSEWIVFEEIIRIGRMCLIRCNTVVTPLSVALFGGPLRLSSTAIKMSLPGMSDDSDSDREEGDTTRIETSCLSLDDWISFIALPHDVLSVYFLRQKFSALLIRRMSYPSRPTGVMDDKIISTVIQVLGGEERRLGLIQPSGIGLRPKPLTMDNMNRSNNGDNQYENRHRQGSFQNSSNPQYAAHNKGTNFFKQGKPQASFQNFTPNRGPLSPSSGNVLLANIEKYSVPNNENHPGASQSIRYFVVRTTDPNFIEASQSKNAWNFTKPTLSKLVEAAETGSKIILFFSIGEQTSKFYGYAEFLNTPAESESSSSVKWLSNQIIPHYLTKNLINNFNENRRVFASMDGQELTADNGRSLIMLLEQNTKKSKNNGRSTQK